MNQACECDCREFLKQDRSKLAIRPDCSDLRVMIVT